MQPVVHRVSSPETIARGRHEGPVHTCEMSVHILEMITYTAYLSNISYAAAKDIHATQFKL